METVQSTPDRERLRVDAVVPVGQDASLLDGCLGRLRAQDAPLDEVIVVDDSPRGDLPAPSGVRVLRSGGQGPYAARNVGWRASEADVVLFLDVRSRPRSDWARHLGAAFEQPAVALASSDLLVQGGRSWGARVGQEHRFFRRERYTRDDVFRTYAPTCNLAVRRAELVAVNGFKEIRSSADVDLCWRIMGDPGTRFEFLPEVLMEWVPRDRLRDYFEQSYRYGKAHYSLWTSWAEEGAPQRDPMAYRALLRRSLRLAVQMASAALVRRDRSKVVECLLGYGRLTYEFGYRRAAGAARRDDSRTTR